MAESAGAVRVVGNQRRAMTALPQRRWLFVPLWGIPTHFCYAPRRVECAEHGVVVEHIPWSGQASSDMRHDGVLGTLGATAELAGNGASVPDQLGSGVSVGGMVCAVGLGRTGNWAGSNPSGWTRFIGDAACGQTTF